KQPEQQPDFGSFNFTSLIRSTSEPNATPSPAQPTSAKPSVSPTASVDPPTPATPATPPVPHTLAIRIAQPHAAPVDLQVSQRAGEVHVAVRTPDFGLQTSLRQELPTLVHSLERAGFHSEVFTRDGATQPAAALSDTSSFDERQESQQNSTFSQSN